MENKKLVQCLYKLEGDNKTVYSKGFWIKKSEIPEAYLGHDDPIDLLKSRHVDQYSNGGDTIEVHCEEPIVTFLTEHLSKQKGKKAIMVVCHLLPV